MRKRYWAVAALVAMLTVFAGTALAQEDPGVIPDDPTIEQLLDMLLKVVTDFRTCGVLCGFIALIGLLVAGLRYKPLDEWLEAKGLKRVKIYVAAGLGAVMMFLTAIASGTGVGEAIVAGLIGLGSGLAAVGGHQVLTKGNK